MVTVEFEKSISVEKKLTTITVKGSVSADQLIKILEDFYQGEFTLNLLWDLSLTDASELKKHELEEVISVAKKHAHLRRGGKTAIVASRQVDYGIGRMYEILAEIENHPLLHYVSNDIQKAKDWFEMKD